MTREKISLSDSTSDVVIKMAEGNPGALTVMMSVLKHPKGDLFKLLDMDDMNLRGSKIWIGFKDHCDRDMDKFLECVKSRDKAMVDTINKEHGLSSPAVTNGASFN